MPDLELLGKAEGRRDRSRFEQDGAVELQTRRCRAWRRAARTTEHLELHIGKRSGQKRQGVLEIRARRVKIA